MKLNSISNSPLYKNPQVQKSNHVVPKEVQKAGFGSNLKAATAKPTQKSERKVFSPQAEKILSMKEKVEIQAKFKAHFQQEVGYSRGGHVKTSPISLGQKLDLKG